MTNHQENIVKRFNELTKLEQTQLIDRLSNLVDETSPIIDKVRNEIIKDTPTSCPHCKTKKIIKWGSFQGDRQRFQCKECKKTFTHLTGTSVSYIKKKDLWYKHLELIFSGKYYTITEICNLLGVSRQTAFDWRHKALKAMEVEFESFKGIVEMDDINLKYSQKGRKGLKYSKKRGGGKKGKVGDSNFSSKVLITADREGNMDMSFVRVGRLKREDIERVVGDKIDSDKNILTSDKHGSIISYATRNNLTHKTFKASEAHSTEKIYHVQYVNNVAERFKSTVNVALRGVSTKYLQNYAKWFAIKEKVKKMDDKIEYLFGKLLEKADAWKSFIQTEKDYETFINTFSVRTYRCPTKRSWASL